MPKSIKKDDLQALVTKLERMIFYGVFQPRERLVENDLAEKLQVSRYSIREALKILEVRGLVTMVRYRGAMVSDLTEEEIEEIFEVRVTLEKLAARLASERFTPSDEDRLRQINHRMKKSYENNNLVDIIAANREFHDAIIGLSGNKTLIRMIKELKTRFHIFNTVAWSSPQVRTELMMEHQQFIEGLCKKDQGFLEKLILKHFSHSKDLFLQYMKARKANLPQVVEGLF